MPAGQSLHLLLKTIRQKLLQLSHREPFWLCMNHAVAIGAYKGQVGQGRVARGQLCERGQMDFDIVASMVAIAVTEIEAASLSVQPSSCLKRRLDLRPSERSVPLTNTV